MRQCVVLGIVLVSGLAHADLDADKARKDADTELADQLEATNNACGSKLKASYDWGSEKKSPPARPGMGPQICKYVLKGVAVTCTDSPEGKKAVAKQIKSVSCKYDGKVTSKKSKGKGVATDLSGHPHAEPHTFIELKKSTLSFTFDWFSANTDTEVEQYLRKQL